MANTKHAVVRTDRLSGTIDGSKLISAKFYNNSDPAEIENGNIVAITNTLIDREVFKVTAPTAADTIKTIGLVASVEIINDYPLSRYPLTEFTNVANKPIRVYRLETGDVFSVTAEALNGEASKGKFVEINASSTKLKVAASGTNAIGEIVDVETVKGLKYFVIVVK